MREWKNKVKEIFSRTKKMMRNLHQKGKVVRSWGLATRFENKKMEKPKKKKG